MSEQFQNTTEKHKIPQCQNNSKIQQKNIKYHTVRTIPLNTADGNHHLENNQIEPP